MSEITVGKYSYKIDRMDAMNQFHVARRLVPVMGAFASMATALHNKVEGQPIEAIDLLPIATAISQLSDDESEYVIKTCLSVVRRLDETSNRYTPMMVRGNMMFQDVSLSEMIKLTSETIMENLGDFFAGLQAQ